MLPILLCLGCNDSGAPPVAEPSRTTPPESSELRIDLKDATTEVGLDFLHNNGMEGRYWIVEMMGPGVAMFDFDSDGDLDLYFRQGGPLRQESPVAEPPTDRLYRNLLAETNQLQFSDISADLNIGWYGYGMGVAAGDYDNDGDPDLFLTNYGADLLLENYTTGFRPQNGPWNETPARWSTAAVFFDANRNGWLDLYIGYYLDFEIDEHRGCTGTDTRPEYCGPLTYEPLSDQFFENLGQGSFRDSSTFSSLGSLPGNTLGAIAHDFNDDGWCDLFVANDTDENFLWVNDREGSFRNEAPIRGVAVNGIGQREGSMGVALADFDRNGSFDLFLTHVETESNTLYAGDAEGYFIDRTNRLGLAAPSLGFTSFGVGWLDLNGDSWLDLLMANGTVQVITEQRDRGDPLPLSQHPQAFVNTNGSRFTDVTKLAGSMFSEKIVGRSIALGDLDNDGDLDIVVTENNGPARVLMNRALRKGHWIGLRLVTGDPPRDALGATATLELSDGTPIVGRCQTDGSYLAATDPRVLLRIPPGAQTDSLVVNWPDGSIQTYPVPELDVYTEIRHTPSP